jgi:hypothetical protein
MAEISECSSNPNKLVEINPKKMGLAILDPPLDWTLFAMICEPKDEDIWGATTHLPGF